MKFGLDDIKTALGDLEYRLEGKESGISFTTASPIEDTSSDSISWVSVTNESGPELVDRCSARVLVCPDSLEVADKHLKSKCIIRTPNPKLVFCTIVEKLLVSMPEPGIHETASVHPEASLAADVYIGPFTYVGKCSIGMGSIIWGNCYIHDGCELGNNVIIHAGCVIGDDGSGYARDESGALVKFPHIGKTILEDDVEVGPNSYVNKGTLGATHLKRGVKIGNAVCIGHNVTIDPDSLVLANTVVSGSTHIGRGVYIAPNVVIRNKISVGDNSTVGLGAVVVRDVPEGITVIGNPAENIDDYRKWTTLKSKLYAFFDKRGKT